MSIWIIVVLFVAGLLVLGKIADLVLERGSFWGFLLISTVASGLLLMWMTAAKQ
jgi:MFS-type transporter involved in bile tolerance (Atg22 family)